MYTRTEQYANKVEQRKKNNEILIEVWCHHRVKINHHAGVGANIWPLKMKIISLYIKFLRWESLYLNASRCAGACYFVFLCLFSNFFLWVCLFVYHKFCWCKLKWRYLKKKNKKRKNCIADENVRKQTSPLSTYSFFPIYS